MDGGSRGGGAHSSVGGGLVFGVVVVARQLCVVRVEAAVRCRPTP